MGLALVKQDQHIQKFKDQLFKQGLSLYMTGFYKY